MRLDIGLPTNVCMTRRIGRGRLARREDSSLRAKRTRWAPAKHHNSRPGTSTQSYPPPVISTAFSVCIGLSPIGREAELEPRLRGRLGLVGDCVDRFAVGGDGLGVESELRAGGADVRRHLHDAHGFRQIDLEADVASRLAAVVADLDREGALLADRQGDRVRIVSQTSAAVPWKSVVISSTARWPRHESATVATTTRRPVLLAFTAKR